MLAFLKRLFRRTETRFERVLRECGCVVRCPECDEILNDSSNCHDTDDGLVEYVCAQCGCVSDWDFDAPAPLLIRPREAR